MNRVRMLFVRNEGTPALSSAACKSIQNLTINLLPKLVRHDTMEGKEYTVVPMVILTEGVHAGSEGAMYYPPDELSKTPAVWNHKPVVVYHPEINGQGVSACDPQILTNRKVGLMMNTVWDPKAKRLKSEAWIEKDRANKVDERIMAAVENNEMMEVSTGVFVDAELAEGEWNGEEYKAVARNYRPDHLALLPDKVGACSIKDGAGFLRNEARKGSPVANAFKRLLVQMGITDNEMSFNNIASTLSGMLRKQLGMDKAGYDGPYCWVCDVYSDFFVYEVGGKLYRLSYSASDTGITLGDEKPVEVQRVTEYRTVDGGKYVGNKQTKTEDSKPPMNKKQTVDAILLAAAALAGSWTEADRETLMAMNEDQLTLISNKVGKVQAPAAPKVEPKAEPAPATNAQGGPGAAPASAKVITVQDYIAAAPPEVQQVLNHSVSVYNEEKQKLVDSILAVKNCAFTKDDLSQRPLGELRAMAALAGVGTKPAQAAPNYAGMSPVPTDNSAHKEEALEMPVINFEPRQCTRPAKAARN